MKRKVRRVLIVLSFLGLINFGAVPLAIGDSYSGKITLVQVTGGATRFYVSQQTLSLYATGDYKDVLLRGFFQKASMEIGYTVISCPAAIQGKCGQVNFISVETNHF